MRLCAIVELFNESSASSSNWFSIPDQDGDTGFTLVCKRDVALCLSVRPVIVEKKPYSRIQVTYGSTVISRAYLPVGPSQQTPEHHAETLAAAKKQLATL
jgi:hypothetical protein